jgi:branched-chain amino acid transport system permease protein
VLLVQLIATGLQTGAIYALNAAGFALIFGATRIFHVAHAATFAIAAYVFLAAMNGGAGWVASGAVSLIAAVTFGVGTEQIVYRPILRSRGSFFTIFVASFGVSIVVQSLIELIFGRSFESLSTPLSRAQQILPGLYVAPLSLVALATTGVLFGALTFYLGRTYAGIGLRALLHSRELLGAYGLSSQGLSLLAFAVGSALVVPGAIFTTLSVGLQPNIGAHLMLTSLAATMVGGIGSLSGAALAGLLLGLAESLSVAVVDTQWSETASFVVLFAFILFRPNGLFGQASSR